MTTIRDLKVGDVFRYTEALDGVEGETETLHVVVEASIDRVFPWGKIHTPAVVSPKMKGFENCTMQVKPDLCVEKIQVSK